MATAALTDDRRDFWFPEDWDDASLPWISRVICECIEAREPPFVQAWYGDRYRTFALEPEWLARSFVENAEKEAEGSRKLERIAASARSFSFAQDILVHAVDEARHARMYIAMLKLAFPGALEEDSRHALLATYPKTASNLDVRVPERPLEAILDDVVQMNVGEIRTRLHQLLLRPVALAVCPEENAPSLADLLKRIYDDEGRHIRYTAEILEDHAKRGYDQMIADLYARRLDEFAAITLKEVGGGQFD